MCLLSEYLNKKTLKRISHPLCIDNDRSYQPLALEDKKEDAPTEVEAPKPAKAPTATDVSGPSKSAVTPLDEMISEIKGNIDHGKIKRAREREAKSACDGTPAKKAKKIPPKSAEKALKTIPEKILKLADVKPFPGTEKLPPKILASCRIYTGSDRWRILATGERVDKAFKFSLGNQDPETTWKNNVLKHVGELEKEWAAKDKTKKKKSE